MSQAERPTFDADARAEDDAVILEFVPVGNVVKVTAVDPVTLTEVSIVGDPRQSELLLQRAALRKLAYVLKKRQPKTREPRRPRDRRIDREV